MTIIRGGALMKKYLYMIAALFGIDYFCKEKIDAQKPEDFPRDMEKSHGKLRLYRNHNDGFCFGVKKEKKELVRMVPGVFTSAAAGILTWFLCRAARRQISRSERFCPLLGVWFKEPV